jgi:glycosyltransferase involved in cell wall biosynthesis
MHNKKIAIIIPVYNESSVIAQVISSLLYQDIYSIIIVDDGSAQPISQTISGLPATLIRHCVNLGQGAALQTGFEYVKKGDFDIIITFDADGQHDVKDLPVLIKPIIENKADVVLGSRFLFPNQTNMPFLRKATLHAARIINFLLSGILLSDAHNGYRAMNKTALEKITLTENRMAHASEILFEIKKHKLRYTEMPVNIRYTEYSRQKGQSGRDSIKVLFDLILHKFFK